MADDIVTRLRLRAAHATDDYLSYAAADEIERLRSALDAEGNEANLLMLEIKRLRAAGDALADVLRSGSDSGWDKAIDDWEEARHG